MPTFIETQFLIARLSNESYKERNHLGWRRAVSPALESVHRPDTGESAAPATIAAFAIDLEPA